MDIPRQNSYQSELVQKLDASGTALTIYVSTVPVCTIPAGSYLVMTIEPKQGMTKQEVVLVESINSTDKTLTIKSSGRAQDRYNGDSPSALEHSVGSKITLSNPYYVWKAVETDLGGKLSKTGDTVTGSNKIQFNDSNAYVFSDGTNLFFKSASQSEISLATLASASGADEKTKITASDTTGGYLDTKITEGDGIETTVQNSGSNETLDVAVKLKTGGGLAFDSGELKADGSSISVDGMSHEFAAGETVDGSSTPQAVYISDGTNSRTTGRFYKADADDTTNMAVLAIGFVKVNASSIGTDYSVQYGGIVSGFTGLTVGVEYYLSTTAGSISSSTPSIRAVPIGIAVSATELLILPQKKSIYVYYSWTGTNSTDYSDVTVDTELLLGFRPTGFYYTASINTTAIVHYWLNGSSMYPSTFISHTYATTSAHPDIKEYFYQASKNSLTIRRVEHSNVTAYSSAGTNTFFIN